MFQSFLLLNDDIWTWPPKTLEYIGNQAWIIDSALLDGLFELRELDY